MSTRSVGNYYANKTKEYYEKLGYQVAKCEVTKMAWIRGHMIPIHTDIWASDLMAMNKDELIFIQVKTFKGDLIKALREFAKYTWPKSVKKVVVRWIPRNRTPVITEVD